MRNSVRVGFGGAVVLGLLGVFAAAGCGGSSGGSGTTASGVTSSKRLVDLSAGEKGTLCDWMVGKVGSYGVPGTCDRTNTAMVPFLAYDDQADCVADSPDQDFADCAATVAQLEACVSALPACATLTEAAAAPACSILSGC